MVGAGERFPDAKVFAAPGEERSLAAVAEGSRALFIFYLFDFSFT